MIRRIINKVFGRTSRASRSEAKILPLKMHGIRREQLDDCALKVCETLAQAGFKGYLVGGAVRDLLLGGTPKDFDVATDATPEEVRRLFRRSRIIGRRFQIVHVMCGRETIEVTTFRANGQKEAEDEDAHGDDAPAASRRLTDEHGRLLSDNVFGSMADDAARRDFTINALYYDPAREEVHDYFGGVGDCKKRVLRMIGDPETRYREDPVRMLRAARFAAKLDFHIDPETRKPVATLAPLLANIPRARIFDEALKLLLSGHALRGVHQLRAEGLHHGMLPLLDTILDDTTGERFITAALKSTDARIQSDRPSSPAFLFGTLLWPQVVKRWKALEAAGEKPQPALFVAMDEVLDAQRGQLAIPRRYDGMMKEIWALQPRFEQRGGQRPFRLLEHPRFRAAYDFLLLRAEAGEVPSELGEWWTRFQEVDDDARAGMLLADTAAKPRRRRKRRKPGEEGARETQPA
ncbi:poly(A) polymerase, PcnB [Thiobacillus denitrificans ATCC 25259]|uniref:Poly(A) polymerase I n=1 Tax=Thiobacillus denitrificans (strain ATCC 25259 / T1) TaxID=292415 RepID=Q3SH86_THIDA|nr:polynucleotide adenylyltransferase PcnB [Thiobacillus denitrificans]AAZ98003.1 poly(A) polymerase, PcnB [Thiobacillus denitrificans ATCC 25259]